MLDSSNDYDLWEGCIKGRGFKRFWNLKLRKKEEIDFILFDAMLSFF